MARRSSTAAISDEPVSAFLPPAESRSKRDRSWEAEQRKKGVVTYRGIPSDVTAKIRAVSEELDVPVGDVVRLFLEHGLAQYKAGVLPMKPRLIKGKYGLYGK
jgi:hypothetical protein